MKQRKAWGFTEDLLKRSDLEVHRIEVEPFGFCSMHHHERKVNAFVLIYGSLRLDIEHEPQAGRRAAWVVSQNLEPGDYVEVPAGVVHRFVSEGDSALALEIYYPPALSTDIVRRDRGGKAC